MVSSFKVLSNASSAVFNLECYQKCPFKRKKDDTIITNSSAVFNNNYIENFVLYKKMLSCDIDAVPILDENLFVRRKWLVKFGLCIS